MKKGLFSKLFLSLDDGNVFHSVESEISFYATVIDSIINAENAGELKIQLDKIQNYNWREKMRYTFLMGLIMGKLLNYNKDLSLSFLNEFKKF